MRIVTLLSSVAVFLLLPLLSQGQGLGDADHIVIRLRPVCNAGQGSALVISFEIKARSGPFQGNVGGYCMTITYSGLKMTMQGRERRYNYNYWPGGTWYIDQSFGPNAWFSQHGRASGYPALPLGGIYFPNAATDCDGNPLSDGFIEVIRYHFQINPSASGTADFAMFNLIPYQYGIAFQHGSEATAIYYSDMQNNGNDSVLTIHGLVVPVDLAGLAATALPDGAVKVSWRTETETSNAGFEVERGDGAEFRTIAFIPGAGNSLVPTDYEYMDRAAGSTREDNLVFYRLKQIDTDGTVAYSHIVSAKSLPSSIGLGSVFPNPLRAGETSMLPVQLAVPAAVRLAVYNALGQRVALIADADALAAGQHSYTWDGRDDNGRIAAPGTYFLRFSADAGNGELFTTTRQLTLIR